MTIFCEADSCKIHGMKPIHGPYAETAARLVLLRKARGHGDRGGQARFAQLLGMSANQLNNYEMGIRQPPIETAIKIHQVTGATLDWLFRGDASSLSADLLNRLHDAQQETAL